MKRSIAAIKWTALATLVFQLHAVDLQRLPELATHAWPAIVSWEDPSSGENVRDTYLGPFFEHRDTDEEAFFAFRPFALERRYKGSDIDTSSFSFLYPLFTYRNYPGHSQWSLFYLLRGSTIDTNTTHSSGDTDLAQYYKKSFEFFPFYFDYNSWNPDYEYFGIMPFYGEIKNRLFYERISWIGFPFYSEWEDNDELTYAFLWPFIRVRTGPHSSGISIWPLGGYFQRDNDYIERYALWPLMYYHQSKLYLDTPETKIGILPLYARETRQSYMREDFLWPFFGYTMDDVNNYEEVRFLWPFFIQGRGDDRYINQIAPLYSVSRRNGIDSNWLLWPLFKNQHYEQGGIEFNKFKFLYFIYQDTTQRVADSTQEFIGTKRHLWPLFSYRETAEGGKQFQMLSLLEPLFPTNENIRKLYSPLFSIFRYQELDPRHKDMELLWSLIHFQRRPEFERLELGPFFGYEYGERKTRIDILKGLLGYLRENGRHKLRLFWFSIDLGTAGEQNSQATENGEQFDHES